MVHQELDSFFWKFKNLLFAEKDATVTFKSEAGKASVSITVDLGHVHSVQGDLPHVVGSGMGLHGNEGERNVRQLVLKKQQLRMMTLKK